ncbi:hypothetical protein RHMOL_Rhmol04G0352200 [Rhododendron molle]|uniref:Uncharacterized protein n=1 Tax=Rhododendron molle TaxID=49168 RepID=A0ACC0P7E0_RHOML|nr:hypothetical protein RHMOL_Rhmol04G0352200 [Rhododendron molle]
MRLATKMDVDIALLRSEPSGTRTVPEKVPKWDSSSKPKAHALYSVVSLGRVKIQVEYRHHLLVNSERSEPALQCLQAQGSCTGDASSAITYFEESVFLNKVPTDDLEIMHMLSVSLNKVGDLKYYDENLQGARTYYFQWLNGRRDAIKNHPSSPSQILVIAVSLAKVADVDRNLGNEDAAVDEFQEAMKL